MGLVAITSDRFMNAWPAVAWHFHSFEERGDGETPVHRLVADVLAGKRQCWAFVMDGTVKACALTKVDDGEIRVVTLTHCAGADREGWQADLVAGLQEWAKEAGAARFRTVNRPGWTKMLRGMGLRETHRIMEVDLGDG